MVRRSSAPAKTAERWFPVRIRVAVPPEGFGAAVSSTSCNGGSTPPWGGRPTGWAARPGPACRIPCLSTSWTSAAPTHSSTASLAPWRSFQTRRRETARDERRSGRRRAEPDPHRRPPPEGARLTGRQRGRSPRVLSAGRDGEVIHAFACDRRIAPEGG
jgi:hypothetical protein